jgi:hypothetical protein
MADARKFFFSFSDSDWEYLLGVSSFFATFKKRGGELCQFTPCAFRKLLKVLFSILIVFTPFKKFLLVDHNNWILGKAKVCHRKLFEKFTSFLHNIVLAAIVCIKDKFVSYNVIGAVKTELLGLIGSRGFKTAVSGQGLIVNGRYVNVVPCDISISSKQFNKIKSIFRVWLYCITGKATPYLSKVN